MRPLQRPPPLGVEGSPRDDRGAVFEEVVGSHTLNVGGWRPLPSPPCVPVDAERDGVWTVRADGFSRLNDRDAPRDRLRALGTAETGASARGRVARTVGASGSAARPGEIFDTS